TTEMDPDDIDLINILGEYGPTTIRWGGHQENVYKVRVGRHIVRFSDLDAMKRWADKCERHLFTHYKERNTLLYEEWAYEFGAKGSRKPRLIVTPILQAA